jgi:hypothetical protein
MMLQVAEYSESLFFLSTVLHSQPLSARSEKTFFRDLIYGHDTIDALL